MKILFITNSYPSENLPVAGYLQDIAVELVHQGHEVRVLVHSDSNKPKQFKTNGVEVIEYPISIFWTPRLYKHTEIIASLKRSVLAWVELFLSFINSFFYLRKYAKDCDIVHAVWYLPSGLVASLGNVSFKKPFVVTALGAEFHLPENPVFKTLLRYVHRSSNAATANSRYLIKKAYNYQLSMDHFSYIPTAINFEGYPDRKPETKKKLVIASICRLIPAKRAQDLIEAIALLPSEIAKEIEIWVVGDGPEKSRLMDLTRARNLDSQTRFLGMIPHNHSVGFGSHHAYV